jgi:hypothetical protein
LKARNKMDFSRSYSATWRVFRVNRKTWADAEQLTKVDSVSLSRTADGSLLESGGMSLTGEFESDYYRIVMTAEQGGDVERVDVATLLFEVNGGKIDYGSVLSDVDGYSVLRPADTTAVVTGEYAPAGVDGAQYVAELLSGAINAPVEVEGGFTLNDHLVFEVGASVLEAAWTVLNAGNYILQVDGRGVVHVMPKPTEPSLIINSKTISLLQNGISFTTDIGDIPNRYIVIDDNTVAVAVNDDSDSEVSTVRRGYCVDIVDTSPTLIDGETHAEYANKMLERSSILEDERTYKREYAPDVYPYSIVKGSINGLDGEYRVKSQTITCNKGITVSEKASMEVRLWQWI